MSREDHWDNVYATKGDHEVSWTQAEPTLSLALIAQVCPRGRVIDVGGGTSILAERLLEAGHAVTVLDISDAALRRSRDKLGGRAQQIQWVAADVAEAAGLGAFDVWHDRAAFHFLTEPADRARYVELLSRSVPAGGHAVIATFAPDGPEKCSGLLVRRYSGKTLADELGAGFKLVKTVAETHSTPWNKPQAFQYSLFQRV